MQNFVIETDNNEGFEPIKTFDELGVSEKLLRGVYAYGWEKPSAIQSVAIRPLMAGRDVLGQAKAGTGKTGAFGIGMLARIDPSLKQTQGLILVPTKELADQINKVLKAIGNFMKITTVLALGGSPRHINGRECRAGPHIVIGTPGRVWDLANAGELSFKNMRMFVIDEADEMLKDRFAEQVAEITKIGFPEDCRVAFFSATMPPEVKELADRILNDPVRVTLKTEDVRPDWVKQYFVSVEDEAWKLDIFRDIYESLTIAAGIIFCNTKERAESLYRTLKDDGFPVSVIYGDPMPLATRMERLEDFRGAKTRLLIATNVLARGIDVQQVDYVFNFDLPPWEDKENYIHRIGRCGRYGRSGTAISLLTTSEASVLEQIVSHYSMKCEVLPQDLSGVGHA
jgi:translation initiation factor 4A